MIKKRYFTISKKGTYGNDDPIFVFENLEGAMEMFKYLMNGKAIQFETVDVPDNKQTPDEDGWTNKEYLKVEKGEPDYHLGSETIEVYTKEEALKIKAAREEWANSYKKTKK